MLNNEQFEEKTISRKEIYSGKIIGVFTYPRGVSGYLHL